MTNELDYAAFHAIAFATGAALSVLLWLMQRGVDRASGRPSGYQLLWVVGIIWTLGGFLRYTLQLVGADAHALGGHIAEVLAWSCTIIGPLAIGRFLQARLGETNRASRWFLGFTGVISVLNLVLMAWAASTHALDVDTSWYPETSLYIALVVTGIALVLYRLHRFEPGIESRPSKSRWFGPGASLLVIVQVTAALLTGPDSWLPTDLRVGALLFSEHWTIPWSILIAVSLAQTHYADVVLKRSLWLLASVSIAALVATFVLESPSGLPMAIATLGCAFLMLIAPSLVRALNLTIDRIFLGRGDYPAAATAFEAATRCSYDRGQLFDKATDTVKSTLRVDARFVQGGEQSSGHALASIPVESADGHGVRLDVFGTHHARTLMQEELRFLNAIAVQVSRRLDGIHFEQEQRALLVREERLKRLLTEAKLKALRTQVDPHFLFNTLNTIADLIGSNPPRAERMTERLAECFRYALASHSSDLSTLDAELEFARHYLEIEQVRFGERLRVQLSRGDADGNEPVPSLLLQPLLENAIKHGLAPLREGGCIKVMAKREGEYLRLQVDDDGVGLRSGASERSGVGLQNVKERLDTLYSQAGRLMIGSRTDGRGTSVAILVPLHAY